MLLPAADERPSIMLIEAGFTAIAVAVAFAMPRLASTFFCRVEHLFGWLAARQAWSVFAVGAAALLGRLALLPLCPRPHPFIPNDFSFLLAADTFASGRLTNPTPAMWIHFESIHITMKPTYMSMYFPAQGLVLAAGKVLLGRPWYGVLAANALMCAAICWMLQAWLPPAWALLGGLLAVLRIGLFSYWINTYSGGGSIAALGGALLLGALPRFMKTARLRYSLLMAVGLVLLATTRPYEGLLLSLPVAALLARWWWRAPNRPAPLVLLRCVAAPLSLLIAAAAWMGYYDYRVFGSPLTLPYSVDRATYAMAPYFVWQAPRPEPVYRHEEMRRFYVQEEFAGYQKIHRLSGFLPQTLVKAFSGFTFFAGIALIPPLIMLPRVFMDRRVRFLLVCVLVLLSGMVIEIFLVPHYLAPFTAAFYALGLQAMRHLRLWTLAGQPVGLAMERFVVTICIAMAGIRACAVPLDLQLAEWPASQWIDEWYGPGAFGMERAQVEAQLEKLPGKQLAIVRYTPDHYPYDEWVYNAADIDKSKVIWAREMNPAADLEIIRYYKDRSVWLVQPDMQPARISPYTQAGERPAPSQ